MLTIIITLFYYIVTDHKTDSEVRLKSDKGYSVI